MIIVVMGVAGSGKSTIAKTLARKLKIDFVDADQFHSPENVQKMSAGVALSDEDRRPWLNALSQAIKSWIDQGKSVALACSALKRKYRDILNVDPANMRFVYLKGSESLFASRLARRKNHFMKSGMLQSQLATLEEPGPDEAIICDAHQSVIEIVMQIISCGSTKRSAADEGAP